MVEEVVREFDAGDGGCSATITVKTVTVLLVVVQW